MERWSDGAKGEMVIKWENRKWETENLAALD